jgi:hypothetical protein
MPSRRARTGSIRSGKRRRRAQSSHRCRSGRTDGRQTAQLSRTMADSVRIRGNGFVTNELVARLSESPGVNRKLVEPFAETLRFAHGLISRLQVSCQETPVAGTYHLIFAARSNLG